MATWSILFTAADAPAYASVVTAIQAVPLAWDPFVGDGAWNSGGAGPGGSDAVNANYWLNTFGRSDAFPTNTYHYDIVAASDGVPTQFYVGNLNGTTWDEAACVAALNAIAGVSCTAT